MEDESVKIECDVVDCKHNLWQETEKTHCNLKHIKIGTRVIADHPHGIEGSCLNMKVEK